MVTFKGKIVAGWRENSTRRGCGLGSKIEVEEHSTLTDGVQEHKATSIFFGLGGFISIYLYILYPILRKAYSIHS